MSAIVKFLLLMIAAFMIVPQFGMADIREYYEESGAFFERVEQIFNESGLDGSVYTDAVKPHSMVIKIDHYNVTYVTGGANIIEGSFMTTSELNASIDLYKKMKEAGCSMISVKMNFSDLSAEAFLGETRVTTPDGKNFYLETFSRDTNPKDDNKVLEKNLPKGYVVIGDNSTVKIRSPGVSNISEEQKKLFNEQLNDAAINLYFL